MAVGDRLCIAGWSTQARTKQQTSPRNPAAIGVSVRSDSPPERTGFEPAVPPVRPERADFREFSISLREAPMILWGAIKPAYAENLRKVIPNAELTWHR